MTMEAKNRLRRLFYNLKPRSGSKTIQEKAAELLERCSVMTLASVDADGFPRPVVLAKIASRGYNEVWITTVTDSVKGATSDSTPRPAFVTATIRAACR